VKYVPVVEFVLELDGKNVGDGVGAGVESNTSPLKAFNRKISN
jgi:hypothetical protein